MNIVDVAQKAQDELIAERAKLDEIKRELDEKSKELLQLSKDLAEKEKELRLKEEEVNKKLDTIDKQDSLVLREKTLEVKEMEYRTKLAELRNWENRLFEIEARHEREKNELAERQLELSREKETYKEKLKKDFLDELSRRM